VKVTFWKAIPLTGASGSPYISTELEAPVLVMFLKRMFFQMGVVAVTGWAGSVAGVPLAW